MSGVRQQLLILCTQSQLTAALHRSSHPAPPVLTISCAVPLCCQHHCRVCGEIYCTRCAQHRIKLHRNDDTAVSQPHTQPPGSHSAKLCSHPVSHWPSLPLCPKQHRVCDACHVRVRSQAGSGAISPLALSPLASADPTSAFCPQLLYRSQSLCARCSFVERSGFTLYPSVVFAALPAQLPTLTAASIHTLPASLQSYAQAAATPPANSGSTASAAGVHLGVCCPVHPNEPFVSLCSSLPFFLRTLTFDHPPQPASALSPTLTPPHFHSSALSSILCRSADMEDIRQYNCASSTSRSLPTSAHDMSLPLLVELSVWREVSGGGWMSEAELDGELFRFHQLFSPSHTFVIKVNGGLLERKADVLTLNRKLHHILTLPPPTGAAPNGAAVAATGWKERVSACPLVVDLTFDRLIDLALLDDTVLLKANVLPCVRYFLTSTPDEEEPQTKSVEGGQRRGVASVFISQMSRLLNALHTITDMSLLLLLTIDEPAPPSAELQSILDFVQAHYSIIRMLVVTRERSPSVILRHLLSPAASAPAASSAPTVQSTDPYPLLQLLESASHGRIHPDDFIPLRTFALLSPVLSMFGFRQFGLTASPFCLMAAVLVNTSTLRSIPLSHIVDLHRLYHTLLPLASLLAASATSASSTSSTRPSVSLSHLKRVQRALKECMLARLDVPDVLSYVSGRHEESSSRLRAVLRNMQVVVLHNKMDVASVDMQRRCECVVVQPSPVQEAQYVAQCTGCI